MSVIRPKPPEDPIDYAPGACFGPGGPLSQAGDDVRSALDRTRSLLLAAPDATQPDRLLEAYNTGGGRGTSELYRILQAARRIRDASDRVIVLGDGPGALGARAIFESCAHPFHNELSRGERGGRPRVSFTGDCLDNDALAGLLDLVVPAGRPRSGDLLDAWAVIVADTGDGGAAMTGATRLFLEALVDSVGGSPAALADRLVFVTTAHGRLVNLPAALGGAQVFTIPEDVGPGASVFTPLGLLPAAVVGVDVVRLLQGAAAMNRRFREAALADNPVVHHAYLSRFVADQGGRMLVSPVHTRQLDAVGRWHERLTARTGVPRVTSLHVAEPRRDPLIVPTPPAWGADADGPADLAGTAWPDLSVECVARPEPVDTILLPRVDEHSVGQLLQFLVLAERLHAAHTPPSQRTGGDSRATRPV